MRAYLSVVIGVAVYQDRPDGVKFEGKPNLVNTGSTPARNIKIHIAAAIVPDAQAETFESPLPEEVAKAPAVAAPHQAYILSAIVKDFVPDADVGAALGKSAGSSVCTMLKFKRGPSMGVCVRGRSGQARDDWRL